jgi:hypothetical protein
MYVKRAMVEKVAGRYHRARKKDALPHEKSKRKGNDASNKKSK